MLPTSVEVISRDVGAQAKGTRLQKLRACELIIDALGNGSAVQLYAAIEAFGDVYCSNSDHAGTTSYSEEDKNYPSDTAFTIVSHEVLNSLVIFADMWVGSHYSDQIQFGFYTPASVGKEQHNGERITRLQVTPPDTACLTLLTGGTVDEPRLLPTVKTLVLDEYESQYAKRPGKGFLTTIKAWSDETWKSYLQKISWNFGNSDHETLTKHLHQKVRSCKLFTSAHVGKEDLILRAILDRFDEAQSVQEPLERFVHKSDVALIFRDAAAGSLLADDPAWQMWERIKANDGRNIGQKIQEVFPEAPTALLETLARKAAASMYEQKALEHDRRLLALKYQIYDECTDVLSLHTTGEVDCDGFRDRLESLYRRAIERVHSCSGSYKYPLTHDSAVRGMVVELIDSCFLSFIGGVE